MADFITVQCPECPTRILIDAGNLRRVAGRTVACPICMAHIRLPSESAASAAAAPRADSAGTENVRLQCPACQANLTLDREAYRRLAGSTIQCIKCDAALAVPAAAGAAVPPAALAPVPPAALPAGAAAPAAGGGKMKLRDGAVVEGKYCGQCGAPLDRDTVVCPACGYNQETGERGKKHRSLIQYKPYKQRHARRLFSDTLNVAIKIAIFVLLGLLAYGIYVFVVRNIPKE